MVENGDAGREVESTGLRGGGKKSSAPWGVLLKTFPSKVPNLARGWKDGKTVGNCHSERVFVQGRLS